MWNFPLFPDRASSLASRVDALFFVWLALAALVALAIAVLIVFFAVKYRSGSTANRAMAPQAVQHRRNHRIEIAWIFIPLGLFIVMFAWAAELYYEHAAPPADAMEVYVVGKQWMWKLEHAGGQREIDELHVPAGRPVRLVMTSQDVIHDFSCRCSASSRTCCPAVIRPCGSRRRSRATTTCSARSTAAPIIRG